ncbi:hypothetical protein [Eshraghiella crossota]|uniref:hypothetical protein n=1 Tax=Eshraghiella crossota TaxID=45851 RepID=UPI004024E799
MSKILESVNKRDFDRRISEVVEMLEEKQLYGTISLIKDLKYYLDLATKEKTHDCNCHHNGNSRDNEPCCRCDSKHTNADRIRNMSDEELLDFICSIETYEEGSVKTIENGVSMHTVTEVREWLQSEAE